MTPEQKSKLQEVANGVKGSFTSLPLVDILNRIHFITNRPYPKCIDGLKMMLQERLIEASFIPDLHLLEAMSGAIDKAMPIIEAFECELVQPGTFEKLGEVKEVFNNMSDGPTDDEPEAERKTINLTHINSNF